LSEIVAVRVDLCTSWNARRLMALVSHHRRNCGNSLQLVVDPLRRIVAALPKGRYCGEAQAEAIVLKGFDIMDTQTLVIIIVLVLLLGGGGWYGRGRWF
jgi:hypothetical protein